MRRFEFHRHFYIGRRLVGGVHGDYRPGWRFPGGKVRSSCVFSLQIGRGAGCRGGVTIFVGRHTGSSQWMSTYRGRKYRPTPFGWEIGWTRNGNRVPYVNH